MENYHIFPLLTTFRMNICRKFKRHFSTTSRAFTEHSQVRVRFAPSPTGSIHLGGLRIALYNYIFAWQKKGKFILRLEDTDKTRVVPGASEEIDQVLEWAGLSPHESPRIGGNYGPYIQSERLDLYKQKSEELLKTGKAYKCFCSPTRLELLRKYQASQREKPRYDGKCRHLTPAEVDEKLKKNKGEHVVRFAITSGEVTYDDGVFGRLTTKFVENMETDPIIMKSDGYPTYHFANVVDDNAMKITHVLRGSEWISSTAKHIQLYQAFGWSPPDFLHFPLITMRDGTKISKRNNQSKVLSAIDEGFKPLATLNFLTNMGGGIPITKQEANELWDFERLMQDFNFKSIASHPGSLDLNRWRIYNSKDLQRIWREDPDALVVELKNLLHRKSITTDLNDHELKTVLDHFILRIETVNDLLSDENIYLWRLPNTSCDMSEYADWNINQVIEDLIHLVSSIELYDRNTWDAEIKSIARKHNQNWQSLMRLTRKLLTNSNNGLPLYEIMSCLKKERLLKYLEEWLKH